MDTDFEVLKNLDNFLMHKAFSGFESSGDIPTGIMASEKNFPLFKEFLDYYNDRHFILDDGKLDTTTNVQIITNICKKYGFIKNNKYQEVRDFALYPSEFFCPKDSVSINITDNTVTIHHFAGSWLSDEAKKRKKLLKMLCNNFGNKFGKILFNSVFLPYRLFSNIIENGIRRSINKIF